MNERTCFIGITREISRSEKYACHVPFLQFANSDTMKVWRAFGRRNLPDSDDKYCPNNDLSLDNSIENPEPSARRAMRCIRI
jgi:hypothetical protein